MADPLSRGGTTTAAEAPFGLFRREALATGPAGTVSNLFADLRSVRRGQLIAENRERNLQGTRLLVDRSQGHGTWELYRLDADFYMVAGDGLYDAPRVETVPGEGFIEFHLRLAGVLEMALPGVQGSLTISGPRLLTLYQAPGTNVVERVVPGRRDSGVSLYCRPRFLADLARANGLERWGLLEEIESHPQTAVWHRQAELSPTLTYVGKSLLDSPYHDGIRLLHAEAKALEVLCEVLANAKEAEGAARELSSESESRQLDLARRKLASDLGAPTRLSDIARAVGMSESKLTRVFKERFGVTLFDYRLECRMRRALELLRCKRMPVTQVSFAVGYRHPTSFAAAFQDFFGFPPSKARTEMA
ncbi:MAG TPA: helix-turn-helix transcriptional regulator [Steroidobacteraceae bacterium]|nr:helix-turn-helix transcriptional regulator [Steroidobacteraceae bacterium]